MLLKDKNSGKNIAQKTAFGGMFTALCVVVLIPSVFETLVYVMPCIACLILMICVVELGKSWTAGIYAASAIISLLIVPNKEAAVIYAVFFGYYPILKSVFEKKLPKVLEYILKFAVFNLSFLLAYEILIHVFGMPFEEIFDTQGFLPSLAKFAVPIMLAMGNLAFIGLDFVLTKYATWYLIYFQKKLHKRLHI